MRNVPRDFVLSNTTACFQLNATRRLKDSTDSMSAKGRAYVHEIPKRLLDRTPVSKQATAEFRIGGVSPSRG